MSQGVSFSGVIARAGTRSDGSLGITVETPELTPEEKLAVFALQNIDCEVTFDPKGAQEPPKEIKGELSKKTHSQRIRAVLFCWWHNLGSPLTFDSFYQMECEKFINSIKAKLEPK
jgi:hypothetical protein